MPHESPRGAPRRKPVRSCCWGGRLPMAHGPPGVHPRWGVRSHWGVHTPPSCSTMWDQPSAYLQGDRRETCAQVPGTEPPRDDSASVTGNKPGPEPRQCTLSLTHGMACSSATCGSREHHCDPSTPRSLPAALGTGAIPASEVHAKALGLNQDSAGSQVEPRPVISLPGSF